MKISYYELLKMMKERNAPKKVKYMQMIFSLNLGNYEFEDDNGEIHFLSDYLTMDEMYKYDEIEILDDEDEERSKVPIKLYGLEMLDEDMSHEIAIAKQRDNNGRIRTKINEIIDYLEKQRKGE